MTTQERFRCRNSAQKWVNYRTDALNLGFQTGTNPKQSQVKNIHRSNEHFGKKVEEALTCARMYAACGKYTYENRALCWGLMLMLLHLWSIIRQTLRASSADFNEWTNHLQLSRERFLHHTYTLHRENPKVNNTGFRLKARPFRERESRGWT